MTSKKKNDISTSLIFTLAIPSEVASTQLIPDLSEPCLVIIFF
jgi:hypothetical protein